MVLLGDALIQGLLKGGGPWISRSGLLCGVYVQGDLSQVMIRWFQALRKRGCSEAS